eukprot:502066_1
MLGNLQLFLPLLLVCSCSLQIHKGAYNFSTYIVGNSPIILLSQHGGDIQPNEMIPNRLDGCWNGTTCIWNHSCNDTFPRNTTQCPATISKDSYTKNIALCLQETLNTIPLSPNYANNYKLPHLIINELHRNKLDPNREIGEAAQTNIYAKNTWSEIHYEWMTMAKNSTIIQNKCQWGLVIDIHGQAKNDYINLGYDLSTENLQNNDSDLSNYLYRTSMKNVIKTVTNCTNDSYICPNNYTMADIIRGENSLGSILNSNWNYLTVPSFLNPYLSSGYYIGGPFAIDIHGSRYGGITDFFQLEINRDLRFNETLRNILCDDFSHALITFIQQWYDVDSCFDEISTTNVVTTNQPSSTIDDSHSTVYTVLVDTSVANEMSTTRKIADRCDVFALTFVVFVTFVNMIHVFFV